MSPQFEDRQSSISLPTLMAALVAQGSAVLHLNNQGCFDQVEGAGAVLPSRVLLGQTLAQALPEATAQTFGQNLSDLGEGKADASFDFEILNGSERRFYSAQMHADRAGTLIIINDTTEKWRNERAMNALLREVSHRSKNLLAIVQSVAMQTAQHSDGVEQFLTKFRGRLHALSGTQDLVTESSWRGTYLHSLIEAQLTRVDRPALNRFRLTGENPMLGPNASLHVGLAIHELASNAVTHGALADARSGNVWVDASFIAQTDALPDLVLEWRESGIAATGSSRPRFGRLVLDRIVPLSVGGTAQYALDSDTLSYRLTIPADQYEA
jgi:two-component sensor histidine kinase